MNCRQGAILTDSVGTLRAENHQIDACSPVYFMLCKIRGPGGSILCLYKESVCKWNLGESGSFFSNIISYCKGTQFWASMLSFRNRWIGLQKKTNPAPHYAFAYLANHKQKRNVVFRPNPPWQGQMLSCPNFSWETKKQHTIQVPIPDVFTPSYHFLSHLLFILASLTAWARTGSHPLVQYLHSGT